MLMQNSLTQRGLFVSLSVCLEPLTLSNNLYNNIFQKDRKLVREMGIFCHKGTYAIIQYLENSLFGCIFSVPLSKIYPKKFVYFCNLLLMGGQCPLKFQ